MAQGLGALAQGFVQGSQLGMQMKRDERQAEESSKLMKLRQAAEGRAQQGEKRAQETHEQTLTLRELQEKRAGSAEEREVKQQEMKQEQFDWRVAKEQRAEIDKKLSSVAPIEYQRVAQGGDFSPEFMDEAKGTRFDPVYMAKPEYKKAATTAFNHVSDLVGKAKAEGANSIGLADVNNTEFLQSLGVLMRPDIERGIGEKDSVTGKTIVNKKIAMIIPYEDQGLVVDVEVELDDGTSYMAPITEGRSRDPDDPVKIIPIDKFMDNIEGYTRMASAYNQPDLQNAVKRYTGTPAKPNSSAEVTKRQYFRELGDIDRDEAKELSKVKTTTEYGEAIAPEEVEAAKQLVKDNFASMREKINTRYGMTEQKPVGKGSASVDKPKGGGKKMTDVDTWAKDDPKKAAFIKSGEEYALESGENPFDAFTPDELEKLYMEWNNEQEADALAELMSQ